MPRLTRADILDAFARLSRVYPTPKQITADRDGAIAEWLNVLASAMPDELNAAVTSYMSGKDEYWPKPGQLRWWMNQQPRRRVGPAGTQGEYDAWELRGWTTENGREDQPCPVCGALPEHVRHHEVRHDHQRHYETGIGYRGPRTGPVKHRNGRACMADASARVTTEYEHASNDC